MRVYSIFTRVTRMTIELILSYLKKALFKCQGLTVIVYNLLTIDLVQLDFV